MKRKNKLTLLRETLTHLDRARLGKAAGGVSHLLCLPTVDDCTNSCQTVCWGCEPPSGKETNCECY